MGTKLRNKCGRSLYHIGVKNYQTLSTNRQKQQNRLAGQLCIPNILVRLINQLKLPVVTLVMENKTERQKLSVFMQKRLVVHGTFCHANKLTDCEDLKDFSSGGYCYQAELSDTNNLVFTKCHVISAWREDTTMLVYKLFNAGNDDI